MPSQYPIPAEYAQPNKPLHAPVVVTPKLTIQRQVVRAFVDQQLTVTGDPADLLDITALLTALAPYQDHRFYTGARALRSLLLHEMVRRGLRHKVQWQPGRYTFYTGLRLLPADPT